MKRQFKLAVRSALVASAQEPTERLTPDDLVHLPEVVQRYLHCTGMVGREKIKNFRATFRGGIRGKSNEPFMKLRSVQYNFMESPTRIFYIVARKMGIPACGVHLYKEEKAVMDIRMLGLIPLVYASGVEMDQSETVTFFNDMCVMAPGSLIDRRITWEETGPLSVEATYRNGRIAIRAQLLFDDSGKLRNFISTDRYETSDGKHYFNYPWQTPISEYVRIDGFLLPAKARLIYNHPDEELCYGEFELTGMQYNCREYF